MFHERDALTCTILPNGNLEVSLADAEAREWLVEGLLKRTSEDMLWEGTEQYWTNGSFWPFDAGRANPFVGLTDAPCIAEDMTVEDDGTHIINGRCWWFPNYMVRDFADDLLEHGRTVFQLAE